MNPAKIFNRGNKWVSRKPETEAGQFWPGSEESPTPGYRDQASHHLLPGQANQKPLKESQIQLRFFSK